MKWNYNADGKENKKEVRNIVTLITESHIRSKRKTKLD